MSSTELLVGTMLVSVTLSLALPHIGHATGQLGGEIAARRLVADLDLARDHARASGRRTALVFDDARPVGWVVAEDGDGDGVVRADISAGVDRPITAVRHLSNDHRDVDLAVRIDAVRAESSDPLPAGSDAIQVGPARLIPFSPRGTSGSGTVYVSTNSGLWAVRVFGATGRTRVLAYRPRSRDWSLR